MTTSYDVLKEDYDEGGLITMEQKEKIVSKYLKGQERKQFINLIFQNFLTYLLVIILILGA